jgi:DNA-nicking Smr family endonuclease
MKRRLLTPEETALWRKVVEKTERLHPGQAPLPLPDRNVEAPKVPVKPILNGAKPPMPKPDAQPKSALDPKALKKIKRGKSKPEARVDLHGMTLDRAHPALISFILSSQAAGRRLVLVITGKGRSSHDASFGMAPYARGVLNRQVPQWLAQPPLAHVVLQVSPAHLRDGGDGAYYVFLRRLRTGSAG